MRAVVLLVVIASQFGVDCDCAGNPSRPRVTIDVPEEGTRLNAVSAAAAVLSGTCTDIGQPVVLSGDAEASAQCTDRTWSMQVNLAAAPEGTVTLHVNHQSASKRDAEEQTRTLIKDATVPTVNITAPDVGSFVTSTNQAAFALSGTCSEEGGMVFITGAAMASAPCVSGRWSATLNLSGLADGPLTLTVNVIDAAGNAARADSRSFEKFANTPAVSFNMPMAGTFISARNVAAFQVSGFCTAEGRSVVVTGGPSPASVMCTASAWAATLDLTLLADGPVTLRANHSDANGNMAPEAQRDFVKDATAPTLASLSVTTASPTSQVMWSLSYGSQTGTFDSICIQENSTDVALCTWVSQSTLPANFTVTPTQGAKALTMWLRDTAGNVSTPVTSNAVTLDTAAPTLASIAITTLSPTNQVTWSLSYGLQTGAFTDVCIQENSTDVALCTWVSQTTLPTTFTVSTSQGSKALTLWLRDAAGNVSTAVTSNSVTLDTVAPTLASMTVTTPSPTNLRVWALAYGAQTGTFDSVCLLENSTTLSQCAWLSQTTLPTTFMVSATTGAKALTIWLRDAAGNVSSPAVTSNAVTLDSTAPSVTLTAPNGGQLVLAGTVLTVTWASAAVDLPAMPVSIAYSTNSGTSWTQVVASMANTGTYGWTTPAGLASANVRVRVSVVDLAGNVGTASSAADLVIDSTAPTFTAGQFSLNGGVSPSNSNFITVQFTASDSAAPVTGYCLKYASSTAPLASDPCWVTVADTASLMANVNFRLGFLPTAYTVYGWAKNKLGLISALTNAGAGTAGTDSATITYAPVAPPGLTGVQASSSNATVNLNVTSGSTVFIKWNASTVTGFPGSPISIFYTTDDTTYTQVAAAVPNAQGAGCTLSGGQTGCYTWTNGAPTSGYFRVRVGAVDTLARRTFRSTPPLNVGSTLKILAGSTDPGTGGSAESAIFVTANAAQTYPDPQSFIISTAGVVFFTDSVRGILKVSPTDGVQQLIIPKTGVATDGAFGTATVRDVSNLAFDAQGRVLMFDYDRIRRFDPALATPVVSTIIGTGASTATTPVAPLSLRIQGTVSGNYRHLMFATPDGKVYFQGENYANTIINNGYQLRVFDPLTNLVTTRTFSGTGAAGLPSQNIGLCEAYLLGAAYDPATSQLQKFVIELDLTQPGCNSGSQSMTILDGASGVAGGPFPAIANFAAGITVGANGVLYHFSHTDHRIDRFDPVTQTFTSIAGAGVNGTCADGSLATTCNVDPADVYTDAAGQVYFLERGRIRAIDASGRVYTIMGASQSFGDGAEAISARMAVVSDAKLWNDGSGDRIVLADNGEFRLREFAIDGTIQTVAGNGTDGLPDTVNPAASQVYAFNGQGVIDSMTIQVDPLTGTIFSSGLGGHRYGKIDRVTGRWVGLVGQGATNYFAPAANGLAGNQINFTGYTAKSLAFDGTRVMVHKYRFVSPTGGNDSFLKMYSVANGTQTALAGVTGVAGQVVSADGTAGTSATIPYGYREWGCGAWDAFGNRWLFSNPYAPTVIRSLPTGGTLGTVATLPTGTTAFAYRHDASNNIIYYCATSTGRLHKYNVTTTTDTTYGAWPIAKMNCTGLSLVYSASRNSLIFPFSQDGVGGVAEYYNP